MNYSEVIISGFVLGVFIALSVGPTLFAVIRYSMGNTYKAGLAFIFGVSFSDILYVTLANFASSALTYLEAHQKTLAYAGSLVFMIIGIISLLRKYKPQRVKDTTNVKISKGTYFKIWGSGFLMNALNPAAVVLWLGAAIKASDYNLVERFLFFGICLGLVLFGDIMKVFLAERIRRWLTPRKIILMNRLSGALIFMFGLFLFLSTYYNISIGGKAL